MGFRDREKRRLVPLKPEFCLRDDRASENLHASIRDVAVDYFRERDILWHDGIGGGPSNHLCCSQSFCVNFWFLFREAPGPLAAVLRGLGFDAAEVLPFELGRIGPGGRPGYMAFEWIGERNYLGEGLGGKAVRDDARSRGHHFTSLDFACRFRRSDGLIQIVSGEWKYTEYYSNEQDMRFSDNGTDRLKIYKPSLDAADCQIVLDGLQQEALFFDLFDQLMRQQLLCSAIVWTRLSCRRFRNNEVRLHLHALAYNLANFMRTLALPEAVKHWSLTSLRQELVKIGARIVGHGRYVTFQMAEVAVPRSLFDEILRLIAQLRAPPAPT